MIDIENQIFTKVSSTLKDKYSGISIVGEAIENVPLVLPCVSIYEADNYPVTSTQTDSSNENHAHLMYEVSVYSNKTSGKKAQAKAILGDIDTVLSGLGLVRTMKQPISLSDATVFEYIARYECVVDTNNRIYRR